jgi:16S rRNA (guanine527-N7)-methyltransferase
MDLELLWLEAQRLGLDVSDERRTLAREFFEDLYRENEHTNLTRVPADQAGVRHGVDSLLVLPLLPPSGRVLDLGCGPGFPSWLLAWANPALEVHALDSTEKAQRFLARHLLPNLKQRVQRAEENIYRESFDAVTGRAFAPFAVQAEVSAAWVNVGGIFVPFRTETEQDEVESVNVGVLGLKRRSMTMVAMPDGSAVRLFPVFEKVRPTPREYPRPWGRIKSRPLGG